MTPAGLVASLERAPSRARAVGIARAHRDLADENACRLALERFNGRVREGRSPVVSARRPARAVEAIAAVNRSPACRAIADRVSGVLAHLEGRSTSARRKLTSASAAHERAGEWLLAGDAHRILVDVLMFAGDHAGARRAVRRAARCYDRSGESDARRRGALAMNLGNLHHRRDELGEALKAYTLARRWYVKARESRMIAGADHNRANVLATMDRTSEARRLYERARATYVEDGAHYLAAKAEYALAGIDLLTGRLDDCIERLEEVKRRHVELDDTVGVAHTWLEQAEALLRLNRSADAESAARRAHHFFSRRDFDAESATATGILAGAALRQGNSARAALLFRRAHEAEKRRGDRVGAALFALGLAEARLRGGRPTDASRIAAASARTFRRRGLASREARALTVQAAAVLACGRAATSRRVATRALELARRRGDLRVQLAALVVLSRVERRAGRDAAAYRRLLSAERCVEKLRLGVTRDESLLAFADDKIEVYEALIADRLARGDRRSVRQALVFAERGKARLLAERLESRAERLTTPEKATVGKLLDRLGSLEDEIARAEARLELPPRAASWRNAGPSLAALTRSRQRALQRLAGQAPADGALMGAAAPDPSAAIETLHRDELILEYVVAEGWFHVFAIDRGGVEAFRRIAPVDQVHDLADMLRFQLGAAVVENRTGRRFAKVRALAQGSLLKELYDLLVRPVAGRLRDRNVHVVPHGVLHGVPFHALEAANGVAIVDRCSISYSPSLAAIRLLSRPPGRGRAAPVVIGAPDAQAPLIEDEVAAVLRHFPTARVLHQRSPASATVGGVPAFLHVAAHGAYSEANRWTGAVRLGDRWLAYPELDSLGRTADLVVLSACHSGRGTVYSGDEWVGLARGFLQAGARCVVAALWAVHDSSAVSLMDHFYEELSGGASVRDALTLAQRRLRAATPQPVLWAPFIGIGDTALRVASPAGGHP